MFVEKRKSVNNAQINQSKQFNEDINYSNYLPISD